jgi:hypothetical protein
MSNNPMPSGVHAAAASTGLDKAAPFKRSDAMPGMIAPPSRNRWFADSALEETVTSELPTLSVGKTKV